jgi:hypothetical protein
MEKTQATTNNTPTVAVEPIQAPAKVLTFTGFYSAPQTVTTVTAQSVGFLYTEAVRLRTIGLEQTEASGLKNAIVAGDAFNSFVIAESLTARGAAEAVQKHTTVKPATIRAYGRIADLAAKVHTDRLLLVKTTNNAQKLGFLTASSITEEAAKAAINAFVDGEKLNTIKNNLHIAVKDSDLPDGEYLNKWLTVHYYGEETENQEQAAEFKAIKRILASIVKSNVKEIVLSALLADKAREEDNEIDETLTPFEAEAEAAEKAEAKAAKRHHPVSLVA